MGSIAARRAARWRRARSGDRGTAPARGCDGRPRRCPRERRMKKSRLEAFSDGVIAIIITIMLLEFRAPHEATLAALLPLWPKILCYTMSFVFIGIYWNNHHHLWQDRKSVV